MNKLILAALGAAALVLPGAASAQQYDDHRDRQPEYQRPDFDQSRGDWNQGRHHRYVGYPQFRDIEAHIRQEIEGGVREDLIERDDARDLMRQLQDIQMQEAREYRVHGWNLPEDDQVRIRSQLGQLDRLVDQIREEQ